MGKKVEVSEEQQVKKNGREAYKYLAPALTTIAILSCIPILYTLYLSFTNATQYTQGAPNFVGLENYKSVITGPFHNIFIPVFLWTVVYALCACFGGYIVGLLLAILVKNKNLKESAIYKAILIIPWALPATIAVMSWQGLLNTQYGNINIVLQHLHIISTPIPWLTNPFWARAAIIIVTIWLGYPFMMNVCLGALTSIPKEYYEAAEVDGASKFTQFRKITLPSLVKTSYPLLISSFAFNFNNFGAAFLITQGGPPRLNTQWAGYTDILASSIYKLSLTFGKYGIGSALSILVFILIGVITAVQMKKSGQFEGVE